MDDVLILKQRLHHHLLLDAREELQLVIIQDPGSIGCSSKLFIDNVFVLSPKGPIALPVIEISLQREEQSLDVL